MAKANATFTKQERLCSRLVFDKIIAQKNSVAVKNLRLAYNFVPLTQTSDVYVQTAFSVSKRLFKKAVDRNRVKRLLREVYRLNKGTIIAAAQQKNVLVQGIIIYRHNVIWDYARLESAFLALATKLIEQINQFEAEAIAPDSGTPTNESTA